MLSLSVIAAMPVPGHVRNDHREAAIFEPFIARNAKSTAIEASGRSVIGPPRTGSTWLYNALRNAVDMPCGVKETQFFNTFYDKGIDWYARHFRYATGDRTIAEVCPYFFHPLARERIKTHIPNCRIVATMRDPVDRIYSAYKLQRHYGWVRRGSFDEALKALPHLGGANQYAARLETWFESFGRENVLVTIYDELRADPQTYVNRVCDFMSVERLCSRRAPISLAM